MLGKPNSEIMAERATIVKDLESRGHEVIDTIISGGPPDSAKSAAAWYLGHSILMMAEADAVYFMEGWEKGRGCRLEHDICVAYDIPIL